VYKRLKTDYLLAVCPEIVGFLAFFCYFVFCIGLQIGYELKKLTGQGDALYSVVKNFLDLLASSDDDVIDFKPDDTRTAIAVLYYRVILVDGRIRNEELVHFRKVLGETLNVSEDELLLFEDKVLDLVKSETSLFPFTQTVRKLPLEQRHEILKHMKQISISDKEFHEFEINLVARTAEMLGINDLSSDEPLS
jgi:uncharacterized tellurite resistance protein B-like protein